MGIDRSDTADAPGDVHIASRDRSVTTDLDVTGKDKGNAVEGDRLRDSSHGRPNSTLQTERTMAYRAMVDTAHRQYAADRSNAQAGSPERETDSLAVSRTSVEDPRRYLVGAEDRPKNNSQPAEAGRQSAQAVNDTNVTTWDGAASASDHQPATAPGGDGNIGKGDGEPPRVGDSSPDSESDDPESLNGGLGELVRVDAKDQAADLLAERIGGKASVRFATGPPNEFDALSTEYVAQAKPANFTLNQAFRNQAKATFEVALQSGRTPYFQFDGPPGPGVLQALNRYADRYGIEPIIDLTHLGENNA